MPGSSSRLAAAGSALGHGRQALTENANVKSLMRLKMTAFTARDGGHVACRYIAFGLKLVSGGEAFGELCRAIFDGALVACFLACGTSDVSARCSHEWSAREWILLLEWLIAERLLSHDWLMRERLSASGRPMRGQLMLRALPAQRCRPTPTHSPLDSALHSNLLPSPFPSRLHSTPC